MQEPKRGSDQDFGRGLEANDNMLFQDRIDHEKQLKNEQVQSLISVAKLTKKSIADLQKFESNMVKSVNDYKEQLLENMQKKA